MYKAHNRILPANVQKVFSETQHMYNTRSCQNNFTVNQCRTKLRSRAISLYGVKLWNNLNIELKSSKNLHCFKNKIKTMYISSCVVYV